MTELERELSSLRDQLIDRDKTIALQSVTIARLVALLDDDGEPDEAPSRTTYLNQRG